MVTDLKETIENELVRFKADVASRSVSDAVRRNLTFGPSILLDDDQLFDLKTAVSEHFRIHPTEVLVIGSGKLGFSIAPDKRYRHFHEKSDFDVALVAPKLFDKIWSDLFVFAQQPDCEWDNQTKNQFRKYLFRGWIRPDLLPIGKTFTVTKEWLEFFRNLTSSGKFGKYKINAGLYNGWHFFEEYQSICVRLCKEQLELGQ